MLEKIFSYFCSRISSGFKVCRCKRLSISYHTSCHLTYGFWDSREHTLLECVLFLDFNAPHRKTLAVLSHFSRSYPLNRAVATFFTKNSIPVAPHNILHAMTWPRVDLFSLLLPLSLYLHISSVILYFTMRPFHHF